jgi:hypothetical protein
MGFTYLNISAIQIELGKFEDGFEAGKKAVTYLNS